MEVALTRRVPRDKNYKLRECLLAYTNNNKLTKKTDDNISGFFVNVTRLAWMN